MADIFRLVQPGSDDYPLEQYAIEIESLLNNWGAALRESLQNVTALAAFIETEIEASEVLPAQQRPVRAGFGIDTFRRSFPATSKRTREQFIESLGEWLKQASSIETAEFEVYGIEPIATSQSTLRIEIRYDLVSISGDKREERVGSWRTEWSRDGSQRWRARLWHFGEETSSVVQGHAFVDVTASAFGNADSYHTQLARGADYWRTVMDGAVGVDVYGNNGVAAGDFDGDGFDDLYICQPAGLPNRLYRNRGNGTFEDVTEKAGVGVLDRTACALFVDFLNRGRQDLLLVCGTGPLLFLNNGDGTFALKRDAFKFAHTPQGTFTHAAIADYDGDGRLDVYFCLYMYYLGLDQYNYPVPYYDARNGPPNYLFHNEGDGTFVDTTEVSGLNVNNDRYSFACAWGDSNNNGRHPDLFVSNDFGSSQLYRNNGDGTFKDVSKEAHVESVGAGMGCCWADFDNDGHQDIYVPSMWEAAGQRVSLQPQFHRNAPDGIRELYQRHARGNALYRNQGDGTFRNVGHSAAVEMGRWSWSSDFWDWDHDGYSDLYVTNGYLTGPQEDELAGFFWRQVVAKSPDDATPLVAYERGWNAINELVRADHTWHGFARNVAFVNNRDGTFTEASGTLLIDFREDSRAFALADLDHDGRLEIVLKNRNAPQVRLLHNALSTIGTSISFCLRGTRSNRDAIGASVTVSVGDITQTKYLQAGSGFLSQHSKELFFGLGSRQGTVQATIRWPSGLFQKFSDLPVGHRIQIEEGDSAFQVFRFSGTKYDEQAAPRISSRETPPAQSETWLIQTLKAPAFELADPEGVQHALDSWSGGSVLLTFWSTEAKESLRQLAELKAAASMFRENRLKVVAINVDEPDRLAEARKVADRYRSIATILFATEEMSGIYNILYRHLLDRRRDLPIPSSLLIDANGMIVKLYQGFAAPSHVASDSGSIPLGSKERMRAALPYHGLLIQDSFERNDFTYGVALYQHGYLDQAADSFRQVISSKPDNANAYYNLGTLNLRRNRPDEAKEYLQRTVELRPTFAEAWNNLGMLAAQQGNADEAIRDFQQSISIRPGYFTAHLNLGNLYRQLRVFDKAQDSLLRALSIRPDDAEIHYSLGMLFVQQNDFQRAAEYLERAIALRPAYPEALNNLGVLYVRSEDYTRAEDSFLAGIKAAPKFDQSYLNLARLYAMQNHRQKARDVLQQLLQLQPDNANARQALEMLQ